MQHQAQPQAGYQPPTDLAQQNNQGGGQNIHPQQLANTYLPDQHTMQGRNQPSGHQQAQDQQDHRPLQAQGHADQQVPEAIDLTTAGLDHLPGDQQDPDHRAAQHAQDQQELLSPAPLLQYERQIIDDLIDQDALCILASGMGWHRVVSVFIRWGGCWR